MDRCLFVFSFLFLSLCSNVFPAAGSRALSRHSLFFFDLGSSVQVAELKLELKLRSLPVSGTKSDLIERLRAYQELNTAGGGDGGDSGASSTAGVSAGPAARGKRQKAGQQQQPQKGLCCLPRSPIGRRGEEEGFFLFIFSSLALAASGFLTFLDLSVCSQSGWGFQTSGSLRSPSLVRRHS